MTGKDARGDLPRAAEAGLFAGALVLVLVFQGLFATHFLAGDRARLGHDYSYFLPQLLNGCYWRAENGLFAVPWFTPALGGGVPFYANPSCIYVSVPQALAFGIGPLAGVRASLLVFAAIGFAGTYALLRRTFAVSAWAALFGAFAFALNGFFLSRMLIGHIAFHSFMLVPAISHWILRPLPRLPRERHWGLARDVALAGVGFAYLFQSGNFYGILPALLTIAGLATILALTGRDRRGWFARLAAGGTLALCLSAAKLSAALAFMSSFPRNDYPLPGADGLWSALVLALRGLFFDAPVDFARERIVNWRWRLNRHELEFSLTWVPLLLLVAWSAVEILRASCSGARRPSLARVRALVCLAAVLALPIALNTYQENWTALLERAPLLGSSSTLIRWFQAYVPLVAVAAALAIDHAVPRAARAPIALAAMLALGLSQGLRDWTYYSARAYDPRPVERAFQHIGEGVPAVTEIRAPLDTGGAIRPALGRNDTLCTGGSQMYPYEPIFGYTLEHFPFGSLRPGPTSSLVDGRWNVKNPALFLFPAENGGAPGDAFRVEERAQAEAFLAYRPFEFQKPLVQRAAEGLNLAALIATAAVFAGLAARGRWVPRKSREAGAPGPAG